MRTLLDEILESPSAILGEVLGGKDDRKPVTYFAPWRYICQIRSSTGMGTGTLIGPRTVLTAAHVVWDIARKGPKSELTVRQGKNGPDELQTSLVDKVVFPTGLIDPVNGWDYKNDQSKQHLDYAIVHLKDTIGNTYGYWSFQHKTWPDDPIGTSIWSSTYAIKGIKINVAGYPGDKGKDFAYWDFDEIVENTGKLLYYKNDTAKGQSGGPVFYRQGTHKRVLIGVHTGSSGATRNRGVFMNRSVQDFIRKNTK